MSNTTPGSFTSKAQASWFGGAFTKEQSEASHRQRRTRQKKAHDAVEAGPPPLPPVGNPDWGQPVYGKDLRVGDTVVHLHVDHETHKIDRFAPYKGGLALGEGARIAYSGSWGISVGAYQIVRILPKPKACWCADPGRTLDEMYQCPAGDAGEECLSHDYLAVGGPLGYGLGGRLPIPDLTDFRDAVVAAEAEQERAR